jgi:hypothetical protein
MKNAAWASMLIAVGALCDGFGCGDGDTLTGPESRDAARASAPSPRSGSASAPRTVVRPATPGRIPIVLAPRPTVPPPEGLTGTWTGSITFYRDPTGGPEPCEKVASIAVGLSQSGETLAGQLETGCHGTLVLHGSVSGGQVSGTLEDSAGRSYGKVNGTTSSNRIQFRTVQEVVNDDGDDSGDDYFTSTRVELSRRQP